MKRSDEYVVRFSELKKETETFEYSLEDSFFQYYGNSYWKGGRVRVLMQVLNRPDGLTLDIRMSGFLNLECDRCLDIFEHPISLDQVIYLKYGDGEREIEDNILMVSREKNEFDISKILYDYLVLSVPVKKTHPAMQDGSSGCNPAMLKKLNSYLLHEDFKNNDPRWDELKKIFDKN